MNGEERIMKLVNGISMIFLGLAVFFMPIEHLNAGDASRDNEITKEIANNVSDEFVTCAAFYMISAEAVRRSSDPETASRYEELSDTALHYALNAANKGRTQEMAQKVTLARLELNIKSMKKDIDSDVSNISVLINNYGYQCKQVMENPEKVLDEWTEKIFRKYGLQK